MSLPIETARSCNLASYVPLFVKQSPFRNSLNPRYSSTKTKSPCKRAISAFASKDLVCTSIRQRDSWHVASSMAAHICCSSLITKCLLSSKLAESLIVCSMSLTWLVVKSGVPRILESVMLFMSSKHFFRLSPLCIALRTRFSSFFVIETPLLKYCLLRVSSRSAQDELVGPLSQSLYRLHSLLRSHWLQRAHRSLLFGDAAR